MPADLNALPHRPFSLAEAREWGVSDAQLRDPRLGRPFRGVRRLGGAASELRDRCRDAVPFLPPDAVFSHATAARLWGLPLPGWLGEELHVLSVRHCPVRRPGVIAWTRDAEIGTRRTVHGLPVTSPVVTWLDLAAMSRRKGGRLDAEWLVVVGDALVSGERLRGGGRSRPLAMIEDLERAVDSGAGRRGIVALREAVGRIRMPVDSPRETLLRLGLVHFGLPEPVVQPPIMTAVGIRHPDLGYLGERVLVEYLGDVHRTDAGTWRRDLVRVQLFEDAGYRVIMVGADDLTDSGLRALAARLRRALQPRLRDLR